MFRLIGNQPSDLHKDIFELSFGKLAILLFKKGVSYQACSLSLMQMLNFVISSSFCEHFYSCHFCWILISCISTTPIHFIRTLASPFSSALEVGFLLILLILLSFQTTHYNFLNHLIFQNLHCRIILKPSLGFIFKLPCGLLALSSLKLSV